MRITKKQRAEVIMEDMQSDLKVVLEYVTDIAKRQPKIDRMAEDVEDIKSRLIVLEVGHKEMSEDIKTLKVDVKTLKVDVKTLKVDVKTLKDGHEDMSKDIKEIRNALKENPTRAELKEIDRRVTRLETRAMA